MLIEHPTILEQLEDLMIVNPYMRVDGLLEQDHPEMFDAAWECEHGRLPGDPTEACGCFGLERPKRKSRPKDPGFRRAA